MNKVRFGLQFEVRVQWDEKPSAFKDQKGNCFSGNNVHAEKLELLIFTVLGLSKLICGLQ
jgi:hypothetical protein